jgi:hypothetical protein
MIKFWGSRPRLIKGARYIFHYILIRFVILMNDAYYVDYQVNLLISNSIFKSNNTFVD